MLATESEPPEESSTPSQEEEPSTPAPVKKKLSEKRLEALARARERASKVAKERRESKLRAKVDALDQPLVDKKTPDFSDDPVVIVEQSESDEERLEGPPGIVFVRRKRAKPKVTEIDHLYYRMFGFNGSL